MMLWCMVRGIEGEFLGSAEVKVDFIDLKAQQKGIRKELEEAIKSVLDHGKYIMGPEVYQLEEELSSFVGSNFAVVCSSGTDALLLSLMSYGIGPGDAVITTPFTFIATAEVISLLGATPVFVDIDEETFNLDHRLLADALTYAQNKRLVPKAIITVDIFGAPCEYCEILEFAKGNDLIVIEDAAQSFGAIYKGKRACSLGDIGCTSFFPAKPLGCYGDGGAVFTNDSEIFEILKSLRIHGEGKDKYENLRIGINGRLDTIQAAILLCKLRIFDEELILRDKVAERYKTFLQEYCPQVVPQKVPEDSFSPWAQFTIRFESKRQRDKVMEVLKEKSIPTAIYYPIPLHLQRAFKDLGYKVGAFPVAERICSLVLSLPMHPYLEEKDQERIIRSIAEAL